MATAARGATGARGERGARGAQAVRGHASAKSSTKPGRDAVGPPRQFEQKEIPRYDQRSYRGALNDLNDLAQDAMDIRRQINELQSKLNDTNLLAKTLMESVNDKESWSVAGDDWTLSYVRPRPSKKIVAELLIQQGVPLAKIEKATKETPKNPYVQIKARGESGGGSGEEE